MATSLERPGVKIRRQVTAATPQAIIPTLKPWVVGPAYEVLDLYSGSTLNTQALLSAPARVVGTRKRTPSCENTGDLSVPMSLRGKTLKLAVNNGPTQSYTFPANLTTKEYMLSLLAGNFTGVTFSLMDGKYLSIQTQAVGDTACVEVKDGDANSILGLVTLDKQYGAGTYKNQRMGVSFNSFPAPRGNISYLHFDSLEDEIKAFYKQSGTVQEFKRTSCVLRNHLRPEYTTRGTDSYLPSNEATLSSWGFSYLNPPPDSGLWNFTTTIGHRLPSYVSRGLVPLDDHDGDQQTPYVTSPGGRAEFSHTFNKAAYNLIDVTTAGKLYLRASPSSVPGYLGNNMAYRAQSIAQKPLSSNTLTGGTSMTLVDAAASFVSEVSVGDVVVLGAADSTGTGIGNWEIVTISEIVDNTHLTVTPITNARNTGGGETTPPSNTGYAVYPAGAFDITVEGVGTAVNPWVIVQKFGAGTKMHVIASRLNTSTATLPDSLAVLGRTTTVADAIDAYCYGAVVGTLAAGSDVPMVTVTQTSFTGGKTGTLVTSATDARYGAVGNYVQQAYAAGTPGWDPGTPGSGTNPLNPMTKTLSYAGATAGTLNVTDGGTPPITYFTLTAAGSWPLNPWVGALGLKITYRAVNVPTLVGPPTQTVTITKNTAGEVTAIAIVQNFKGGVHTVDDVTSALVADVVVSAFVGVSNIMVDPDLTNMTAFGPSALANAADPQAISTVPAAVAGDVDVTIDPDTSLHYDASTPLEDVSAAHLTGGWDPINFQEFTANPSSEWNYGHVIGARDLKYMEDNALLAPALVNKNLQIRVNGGEVRNIVFQATDTTVDRVIDRINGTDVNGSNRNFGVAVACKPTGEAGPVVSGSGEYLCLTAINATIAAGNFGRRGIDSVIEIVGGSAVETLFSAAQNDPTPEVYEEATSYIGKFYGCALSVAEGDILYNSGTALGTIIGIQDASVGNTVFPGATLVLDTERTLIEEFNGWYIRAENIDFGTDNSGSKVRPLPEFFVDTTNAMAILKNDVARDATGVAAPSATFSMYVTYRALRGDLTRGINIRSDADLELVTPLTPANPLGLALSLAWTAGSGIVVSGLGLGPVYDRNGNMTAPAISDVEPYGTFDAYSQAKTFLSTQDVYTITPLTPEKAVIDLYKVHVETMSDERHKREQILLGCLPIPKHVTSRTAGTGTATAVPGTADTFYFDPGTINVVAAMADLIDPETGAPMPLTGSDLQNAEKLWKAKLYVNISSDSKNYLVREINDQEVRVWIDDTWFQTHEGNEDGFYATSGHAEMEVDGEPCGLYQRGRKVASAEEQAEAMAAIASGYDSYRVRMLGPDWIEVPVNGLATRVEGHYLGALAGARVCCVHPSQPLTGDVLPLVSNTFMPEGFTDYEQGIAAHGGCCLALTEDGVTTWRDFVTCKPNTIEEFEHSMLTPDDVAAKLLRTELKPYVGPLAIDRNYINRIGMVADAVAKKLVQFNIFATCSVASIEVDENDPRQLIVKLSRSVYYPARGILVILV